MTCKKLYENDVKKKTYVDYKDGCGLYFVDMDIILARGKVVHIVNFVISGGDSR